MKTKFSNDWERVILLLSSVVFFDQSAFSNFAFYVIKYVINVHSSNLDSINAEG